MTSCVLAAEEMIDDLRAASDAIEVARRIPEEWSRRFARAGFYRLCVPEVYGGLEAAPMQSMRVIETLARADGSAAWVVFIGATSGSVLAYLPAESCREIFHDPEVMLAGVFAPRGKAIAVEGGFQVNGRWQWGSGTQNADWVMGGCQVVRDGVPESMPNGAPRSRMMLAPKTEIEFFDTWHVAGLCGTGSTDFAIHDLFVPESRALGLAGGESIQAPLYAFPQFGLLAMGIAAVTLGLARAAIDELVGLAAAKTPSGSARSLANRPRTQADVSSAEAMLRSVRSFFYETVEQAYESAKVEGRLSVESRRDVRLATSHAVGESGKAVDLMYRLAGGSSVYRHSPLQRIFQDVHVASQHMMVAPAILELTGRLFLGLETDTALL
jgi:alkylation response protein AidB-like acyl-CoA dehydrogenase